MNWVIVATFMYPHEAHLARGFLNKEGIETLLKDELTAQVNNFYSNAIGGVKLLVRESDYEKGIEVLKKGAFIKERDTRDEPKIEIVKVNKETDVNHCPFCNSDNVSKKRVASYWVVVLMLMFHAIFPIFRKTNICFDCEKEWRFVK